MRWLRELASPLSSPQRSQCALSLAVAARAQVPAGRLGLNRTAAQEFRRRPLGTAPVVRACPLAHRAVVAGLRTEAAAAGARAWPARATAVRALRAVRR